MGLDLYIEARIRKKHTKRIISSDGSGFPEDEEHKGYFEICWWCGWEICDVRAKMIEICNQHAGTNYTDEDYFIPLPQSALREIYALLVNRSYLPDDEEFEVLSCNVEWLERDGYERNNLFNAMKLHDLLFNLNQIKYDNMIGIEKEHIPDEHDFKLLNENPQAYEWEFRIFNSY